MLALATRFLGYAALMAAMVVGVLDGARGIADGVTRLSSLTAVLDGAFPRAFPAFGEAVGRFAHPALWDPVLKTMLQVPATPALFALGLGLLLAGRRGQAAILPPE
jgi:hypothetical protein